MHVPERSVKDIDRVRLPIVQEEENWRVLMSDVGGGVEDVTERPASVFHLRLSAAVRSGMRCILVSGLMDAFVTAFNVRRTNRGIGLNLKKKKKRMYGRIYTMAALCPA